MPNLISDVKNLQYELREKNNKLERLYEDISSLENDIKILMNLIERESLPTELYERGCKLKHDEDKESYLLVDRDDEIISRWGHSPSLGELFDVIKRMVSNE